LSQLNDKDRMNLVEKKGSSGLINEKIVQNTISSSDIDIQGKEISSYIQTLGLWCKWEHV
jgi:hypothetical protein